MEDLGHKSPWDGPCFYSLQIPGVRICTGRLGFQELPPSNPDLHPHLSSMEMDAKSVAA